MSITITFEDRTTTVIRKWLTYRHVPDWWIWTDQKYEAWSFASLEEAERVLKTHVMKLPERWVQTIDDPSSQRYILRWSKGSSPLYQVITIASDQLKEETTVTEYIRRGDEAPIRVTREGGKR